jgi:predicted dehydrogenase
MTRRSIRFAAIGLNHNHIYGQTQCLLDAGAELVAVHATEDDLAARYQQTFPQAKRAGEVRAILEDPSIQLVVTAITPDERGDMSIAIMRHGKDVMADKPGTITLDMLAKIRAAQAETKRIWSVCYSERFETRSTVKASELGSTSASATAAFSPTSPRINATSSCISRARRGPRWWHRISPIMPIRTNPSLRISAR